MVIPVLRGGDEDREETGDRHHHAVGRSLDRVGLVQVVNGPEAGGTGTISGEILSALGLSTQIGP